MLFSNKENIYTKHLYELLIHYMNSDDELCGLCNEIL